MDITFNCPHCEQELEVDASASGSTIECPACGKEVTIPVAESANGAAEEAPRPAVAAAVAAAAKDEKHFSVPDHSGPAEALIKKAARPLEVAARDSDKKMRIKTFKRTDCQEVGKDHFDEIVSAFLDKVGQPNVVSITAINYSYVQIESRAIVTDYGVLIVYRG